MSVDPRLEVLAVGSLLPPLRQPRSDFPEPALRSLAESLAQGVESAICVEDLAGGRFRIVTGERRWRAALRAGVEVLPCLVFPELEPTKRLLMQLRENLVRQDLNVFERARALRCLKVLLEIGRLQDLLNREGVEFRPLAPSDVDYEGHLARLTEALAEAGVRIPRPLVAWREVEELVGISETERKDTVRVLGIEDGLQESLIDRPDQVAFAVASLPSGDLQRELAGRAAREGLTGKETRALARDLAGSPAPDAPGEAADLVSDTVAEVVERCRLAARAFRDVEAASPSEPDCERVRETAALLHRVLGPWVGCGGGS